MGQGGAAPGTGHGDKQDKAWRGPSGHAGKYGQLSVNV
jgi:hypothetical protein